MIIITTNTIVQPNTVVVVLRNAGFAKATMLAPCRLEKMAGRTFKARVKERPIIWVAFQFGPYILRCNEGLCRNTSV
jgi:hypothetical protein